MKLLPVTSNLTHSHMVSSTDVPVAGSTFKSFCSICFETIGKSMLALFLKDWEFLKVLFCYKHEDNQALSFTQNLEIAKEVEVIYESVPESTIWSIKVVISGKTFLAMLDTGCNATLMLEKGALESLNEKTFVSKAELIDYRGNVSSINQYQIPVAQLGGSLYKELTVFEIEQNSDYFPISGIKGLLGLPFFEKIGSVFIDSLNHLIFDHKWGNSDRIKELGYEFSHFTEIPLSYGEEGQRLIIQIETDFGLLRFQLDTGSTVTGIKPSVVKIQKYEKMTEKVRPCCKTSTFKMGSKDFGSISLALVEFGSKKSYDGLLGMDFLRNFAFDLDVAHRTLFIGDSLKKSSSLGSS